MADDLLQNLWLNRTTDVAVNTLTIRADRVTVLSATTGGEAGCPSCGTVSTRVHSSYVRRLEDRAAGWRRVVVELRVRQFRCCERVCPRATFVEQAG
ncbi:transposase family protein [Kitasatospora sp. NPDC101155]|uniref:transposase family protein n=1 Tax=Kitasatospora sp. NPDC101155 TaxID=3364097 RepID=UPI00380CB97C